MSTPSRWSARADGRAARAVAGLLVGILLGLLPAAGARPARAGGTDIRRVDEFIDAPRVLFGDSTAQIIAILGPPIRRDSHTRRSQFDPSVSRELERLTYPGLVVEARTRLVHADLRTGDRPMPYGLGVGAPRSAVGAALGEPTQEADDRAVYLYSDGFPKTVTFYFVDGRVGRIEWDYWLE